MGGVIWIGRTRKNTALDAFFKEPGAWKCSQIQVCMLDMWEHELRKRNFPTFIDR
ncbi:MAG: transposase [Methanosarcinales archaeon]|nr:transposase [Methanosarcinales archaeon]